MNNDLEQFSEERLMQITQQPDSSTIFMYEVRQLARIALAAKQAKPALIFDKPDSLAYRRLIQTFEVETKFYTTPQPVHTEQDGWIKCGDRMPEELDKNYQVVALSVKKYDEGNYIGEPKKTIVQDWVIRLHPLNFTHWMPLPAAPKPESE